MEFRNYREEDYDAVCDFLIELNKNNKNHINWNWEIGRASCRERV